MSGVHRGIEAPPTPPASLIVRMDGNLHLPSNSRLGTEGSGLRHPSTREAVFLDRDGTMVEDVHFLRRPEDLRILPGVPGAMRSLQERFYLIVVTNQSGVARGLLTEDDLLAVHAELVRHLSVEDVVVDALYYCPHLPDAPVAGFRIACDCRKPAPGMLLRAAREWEVDIAGSYVVGDRPRDVEAGRAAGARSILLGDSTGASVESGPHAADLAAASRLILGRATQACP